MPMTFEQFRAGEDVVATTETVEVNAFTAYTQELAQYKQGFGDNPGSFEAFQADYDGRESQVILTTQLDRYSHFIMENTVAAPSL